MGFLAGTLSTEAYEEIAYKFHRLPRFSIEVVRSGTLKHARVVRVRKLSRRYLVADLKLIEDFDVPPGPAQFIMIWIPGVDYIPMSVANYEDSTISIFFSIRGEGTRVLAESEGKILGVAGPFGKALPVSSRYEYVLVAGGTGLAPIIRLAKELNELGLLKGVIWGTRTAEDAGDVPSYFKEVTGYSFSLCTEDCSMGFCGRATDLASLVIPRFKECEVIVAGPNDMLAAVANLELVLGRDPILIMESMVECGLGLCGSCVLGRTGLTLCKDGPAFRASQVLDYLVK